MRDYFGRKPYSAIEIYMIMVRAWASIKDFTRAKKTALMDEKFIERIMLAVTEVNGCELCSFAHAKAALQAGMSDAEIKAYIDGLASTSGYLPQDEAAAVFFAQSYADNRGKIDSASFETILERYGREKTNAVLAATRLIMMGNSLGIPLSSLKQRFSGKDRVVNTSLAYEVCIPIFAIVTLPFSLIHAVFLRLIKKIPEKY